MIETLITTKVSPSNCTYPLNLERWVEGLPGETYQSIADVMLENKRK